VASGFEPAFSRNKKVSALLSRVKQENRIVTDSPGLTTPSNFGSQLGNTRKFAVFSLTSWLLRSRRISTWRSRTFSSSTLLAIRDYWLTTAAPVGGAQSNGARDGAVPRRRRQGTLDRNSHRRRYGAVFLNSPEAPVEWALELSRATAGTERSAIFIPL